MERENTSPTPQPLNEKNISEVTLTVNMLRKFR